MIQAQLAVIVAEELSNLKALNIISLDVQALTSVTDTMIIASGTSDRHVKAIATHLVSYVKSQGVSPIGYEGKDSGEWIVVDLGDVVVHLMLPRVRDFYNLEKLWSFPDIAEASA